MDKYSPQCALRKVPKPKSLQNVDAAFEVLSSGPEAMQGDVICTGPRLLASMAWPALVVARLRRGGIVLAREVRAVDPAVFAWAAAILFIVKKG